MRNFVYNINFDDTVKSIQIRDISSINIVDVNGNWDCWGGDKMLLRTNASAYHKIADRITKFRVNGSSLQWSNKDMMLALLEMTNITSLTVGASRRRRKHPNHACYSDDNSDEEESQSEKMSSLVV